MKLSAWLDRMAVSRVVRRRLPVNTVMIKADGFTMVRFPVLGEFRSGEMKFYNAQGRPVLFEVVVENGGVTL